MKPAGKILCPVDFSDASRAALHKALELARGLRAELIVLHVLGDVPLTTAYTGTPFVGDLKAGVHWAEKELDALIAQLPRDGVIVSKQLVHSSETGGRTESAIVAFAEQAGVEFIVIGKHGRSRLEKMFFGSVTDRVLRHAPCPVVVVPPVSSE
jgi:nucleotide-binding universal stress UspA family protein